MYLIPDLTGVNELYKVDNDQRMIITHNQKIHFNDAIFLDSIQVTMLGTVNRVLAQNADWAVDLATDLDIDRMASMKLVDSSFNKQLVKSITIIKPFVGAEYKINCAYQKLYPVHSKVALYPDAEPLMVTPDLIRHMLEMIQRHDYLLTPVKDVSTDIVQTPWLLELDPHKERNENYIIDERHMLNVPENVAVIHPIGGAFFADSVTIKHVETNTILTKDVHYKIFGLDTEKTKMTSNPSGIYKFILFLEPYVGHVDIGYHAFGGDPTIQDLRFLTETNNNILQYLTDVQLLTPQTVSTAPAIVLLRNKIEELEENMRRLATTGRPTYGDVSNGGCLRKRIAAVDTAHHWWTLASLYKVEGSNDVFVADTMKLRIQSFYTKFSFDVIINVNLLHPTDKLDVKILSATYPKGYIPFEDYTELQNIIRPQFRIIWNDNTVQNSGAYLQIGLRLKNVAEETLAVEDWSGPESAWKLIPSPTEAVFPEDGILTLPNDAHVWDTTNPDSREVSYLAPFPDGHLIWAGSEALNRPSAGWKNLNLTHILENEIDISNIRRIRCDLEEQGANKFPVTMDLIPGSNDLIGNTSFTYNGKAAYLTGRIYRNPSTGIIELSVNAEILAGLTSNQLNLRQVLIFL